MITVGGFNSSIDRQAEVARFRAGAVNRLTAVSAHPGGKGVHVAQACAILGEPVRLVGIVDAAHTSLFHDVLTSRRIDWRPLPIDQSIRSCYAIRDDDGAITELLEPGPCLADRDVKQLERLFLDACDGAGAAVLSGSLPRGCPDDLYARLVERLHAAGIPVIVDTSGAPLACAVEARPTVVKPNAEEAGRLTGREIADVPSALPALEILAARGLPRIVISLGPAGAVASWDGRLALVDVPPQRGGSAVGSGDCFVGALAAGLVRGRDADATLRRAAACAAANVLSPEPGFFRIEDADRLMEAVEVRWL